MFRSLIVMFVALGFASLSLANAGREARKRANPSWKHATRIIDSEVTRNWRKRRLRPASVASDAELVRRVTLDLVGRIPTSTEARRYLTSRARNRLERYVDVLLASEDYAHHWTDKYSDLLLTRSIRSRPIVAAQARQYLHQSFRANKPMSTLATELLSGSGELPQNKALSYLVGRRLTGANVEQLAGTTARIFLGVQIQCAQCHDHPYDKRYKQRDFSGFAAFFGKTVQTSFNDPVFGQILTVTDQPGLLTAVAKYSSTTPTFLGKAAKARPGESRRRMLARLIVGSPLFAKVTVNRTWDELFGRAIVSPWGDLGGEGDPKHPTLLTRLAREFAARGFDHKLLLKSIVMSKAYRRASRGGSAPSRQPDALETAFARARVRPLSPDQLLRSQLLATGITKATNNALTPEQLANRKRRALERYLFVFGDDEMGEVDAVSGTIPQALLIRNGALTNSGTLAGDGMVLGMILAASQAPKSRLRSMFLAAYARFPRKSEEARFMKYLSARKDVEAAYEDIYYAMLTSTEFNSNH